jgi:hypothetical protein
MVWHRRVSIHNARTEQLPVAFGWHSRGCIDALLEIGTNNRVDPQLVKAVATPRSSFTARSNVIGPGSSKQSGPV